MNNLKKKNLNILKLRHLLKDKKNIDTNVCITFRNSIHATFEQ